MIKTPNNLTTITISHNHSTLLQSDSSKLQMKLYRRHSVQNKEFRLQLVSEKTRCNLQLFHNIFMCFMSHTQQKLLEILIMSSTNNPSYDISQEPQIKDETITYMNSVARVFGHRYSIKDRKSNQLFISKLLCEMILPNFRASKCSEQGKVV